MKKINVLFLLLVSVLILCVGCSKGASSPVGKWEIDYANSSSLYQNLISNLTLNEDGTFLWGHNSASTPEKLDSVTGSYEISKDEIVLKNDSTTFKISKDQLTYGGGMTLVKAKGAFTKTGFPAKSKSASELAAENEEIKVSSTQADFVEINGHYADVKNKPVYATGSVSFVDDNFNAEVDTAFGFPNLTLTVNEGDGFGMYYIINCSGIKGLKDGDNVTVYGKVYQPHPSMGMPTIIAAIIEKQ